MWIEDRHYFKEVSDEECDGSTYMAVNLVAKRARNKLLETNGAILDSKAISWALTGVAPKIHKRKSFEYAYHLEDCNILQFLDDMLCCVDDIEVCESVRQSYESSVKVNHLIYYYNNSLDEPRKARTRVLTRIVWDYHINEHRGGHQ